MASKKTTKSQKPIVKKFTPRELALAEEQLFNPTPGKVSSTPDFIDFGGPGFEEGLFQGDLSGQSKMDELITRVNTLECQHEVLASRITRFEEVLNSIWPVIQKLRK